MVRISDILKQKGQGPESEDSGKGKKQDKSAPLAPKQPVPKAEPPEFTEKIEEATSQAQAKAEVESEAEKEMQVAKAMREIELAPEESHRIYNQALTVVKEVLNSPPSDKPLDLTEASEIVKTIVERILLGDKELILGAVNYSEDNYLYSHSVNVCIYAIDMGLALGYNKSKLNEIGLGALLHDAGMMTSMDVAKEPRRLNKHEYVQIKKHAESGVDIIKAVKDIQEEVICIVKQHHERLNGSGYPQGLKDDQIHEYAQIVAILDVFEALTHPRNYREAFNPHNAIKELLDLSAAGLFKTALIKVLINRIGLYPLGSWVELNTGEIAKVVSTHEDAPLRPKVNIIFGADKETLPHIKLLDLSHHTNIFIKKGINPKDLKLNLD